MASALHAIRAEGARLDAVHGGKHVEVEAEYRMLRMWLRGDGRWECGYDTIPRDPWPFALPTRAACLAAAEEASGHAYVRAELPGPVRGIAPAAVYISAEDDPADPAVYMGLFRLI